MQGTAAAPGASTETSTGLTDRDMILSAAGMVSGMVYFLLIPKPVVGGAEPIAIANSLVSHGRFADPFISTGATGPTAHLAPLFPFVLAVFLFVMGKLAIYGEIGGMCLAHGIHAALLPRISRQFFGRDLPGLIAAVCTIVFPIFLLEPVWENMCAATAVVAFCLWARRFRGAADGARYGAAAGLLALLNPSLVALAACWLAYSVWRNWPGTRNFIRCGAACAAACLLVLLPWEIRIYRELGGFAFVRDNLGMELYAANNDCAQPTLIGNLANGCQKLMHPIFNPREMDDVQQMGELNYNRDRQRRAWAWISTHSGRFRQLLEQRFWAFWFPPGAVWIEGVTWLSLAGLAIALRRREEMLWFALPACALYPLTYYLVQVSTRFRFPILWISLLLMGYFLEFLWNTVRPGRRAGLP
jgi:hypothetical protein